MFCQLLPISEWRNKRAYLCVVSGFGEQVECQALLHTTGSSATLLSVAASDVGLHQSRYLSLLIVAHLTMLATVDNTSDVGNGDSRLGNVGSFC